MKILHTSDWHLGRVIYGRSLLEDQEYFIRQTFLPAVDGEKPDLVVIAGDVFDRQIAPVEAIRLFGYAMTELCMKRGIPTAVIAGNHDGGQRLAVYSEILRPRGLYLSAVPFDTEPIVFEGPSGAVQLQFLPHFDPAQARDLLGRDDIHGYHQAYQAVLEVMSARNRPGMRHVILSHCFVRGASVCESESPLAVGGSAEVGAEVFSGFDYVALGHLHGPQPAGPNGCYSGSPLKYSFDEEKHRKSLTVTEITDDGVHVRRIDCKPLRDMRTVSGGVREIIRSASSDPNREDYIYADLTDTRPVFEPMDLLREYYPNILGLRPGWLAGDPLAGRSSRELKDRLRVNTADSLFFEEFLKQICGVTPEEDEIKVFETIMREIHNGG